MYDATFPTAALDATLAVASAGRIEDGDYDVLVGPLALALPWLWHHETGQPTLRDRAAQYLSNFDRETPSLCLPAADPGL
jgi:hypothetical protein